MLLMMIFPFASDPLVTVSITILNTIGIVTVLLFVLMWRRAASPSDTHATTNQPTSKRSPATANFDVTSDPPVVADLPDEGEYFLVPVGANPPPASCHRPTFETPLGITLRLKRNHRTRAAGLSPCVTPDRVRVAFDKQSNHPTYLARRTGRRASVRPPRASWRLDVGRFPGVVMFTICVGLTPMVWPRADPFRPYPYGCISLVQ
jgi:hypothetical protein